MDVHRAGVQADGTAAVMRRDERVVRPGTSTTGEERSSDAPLTRAASDA